VGDVSDEGDGFETPVTVAPPGAELARSHACEQRGSERMDVAIISGATFTHKAVTYYDVNGIAIVEGDIALGAVSDVRRLTEQARFAAALEGGRAYGVGIPHQSFRWPNCLVPYEVDPELPAPERVLEAIEHWSQLTPIRFVERTPDNASRYPNYLRFTDAGGCWSYVGMRGGKQDLSLGAECDVGSVIHEIGHAVGLWHEQSREDRDLYVIIHWENIQDGMKAQFNQRITDGDDYGPYDYGSIMHYPSWAFSKNGKDTITPIDPNVTIGQRDGLSPGDVATVMAMYPRCSGGV
jgi:hypothetical protein